MHGRILTLLMAVYNALVKEKKYVVLVHCSSEKLVYKSTLFYFLRGGGGGLVGECKREFRPGPLKSSGRP